MIHVKRAPTPKSLKGKYSRGGIEKAKAIAAHKTGDIVAPQAYKSDDVVEALQKMFNKKCAYCEFNYSAGSPVDVEHFRPKMAVVVNKKLKKPGYYWLGAQWTNLLPSCIDCNRGRTQKFPNQPPEVSGKANKFPVANEKHRWKSHRTPNREAHLLLDPCVDKPEKHLEFTGDGMVLPAANKAGVPSRRGTESIKVFGLCRFELYDERGRRQSNFRALLEAAVEAQESAAKTGSKKEREKRKLQAARLLAAATNAYLGPREPFHAAMRAVLAEFDFK